MLDASVTLPSGKRTDELVDLKVVSSNDAAYLIGRYMFSHCDSENRYRGNIAQCMKAIWPGQDYQRHNKNMARILRRHGFTPTQDSTSFYWQVPAVFPVWNEHAITDTDDGSQTTGGPVTTLHITQQMRDLYGAVAANRKRKPREYAKVLGWNPKLVSSCARSLAKHGYIIRKGKTMAAHYDITDKVLPMKNGNGQPKVVVNKPRLMPVTRQEAEAELVEAPQADPEYPSVAQLPVIYHLPAGYYQVMNGRIAKVHIQEVH